MIEVRVYYAFSIPYGGHLLDTLMIRFSLNYGKINLLLIEFFSL